MISSVTHLHAYFANPFLVCIKCREPVPSWHDDKACGCGESFWNNPCGHKAGVSSTCITWSPVTGCFCRRECR